MNVIDFHNHFYPPEYLEAIQKGPSNIRVTFDEDGNPVLHSPGDVNFIVPAHRDIAFRQEVLERAGVTRQVLTFTAPGTLVEEPKRAAELARTVNDALARIKQQRSERFTALATLPLHDPQASVEEFERVTGELGFRGVMVYGNANGKALADQQYWPLYERANDLGSVFYIHPNYPVGLEAMADFGLMPLVGFMFDTTLAAAHLVLGGVAEEFPNVKWVLGHLGGAIPYLAERLDRGYYNYEQCADKIRKPPSEYLKNFYYDTVNFDPKCLQLAIDFAGVERIIAGSDYPHLIGSLEQMVESIESLDISDTDKSRILAGNAAELLGL
ncbi:MAG: amidohydrolase family protein [Gammaproteobacteria bacterium]|nr:MAG: amidohydrolase family protein [Gammaproteobacteria bacterium]